MKKAIAFVVFALLGVSVSFAQDSKEATVQIKTSAVCKMCKANIEKQLAYEKGVKSATVDVDTKVATVVYNPAKTDVAKIKKSINKSGYDADEMPANAKAHNGLEDCCKKGQPAHTDN